MLPRRISPSLSPRARARSLTVRRRAQVNGFTVTMVILLFLLHPLLTRTGLRFFTCSPEDMGGPTFLEADFTMQCWEGAHLQWALTIGAALLGLYAVGIPMLALWLLGRARRQGLVHWRPVLGFLFNGFKEPFFYWQELSRSANASYGETPFSFAIEPTTHRLLRPLCRCCVVVLCLLR